MSWLSTALVATVYIINISIINFFDRFLVARLNIVYPMLFKLTNTTAKRSTHCGVLEFVADEGQVYIPHWVSRTSTIRQFQTNY